MLLLYDVNFAGPFSSCHVLSEIMSSCITIVNDIGGSMTFDHLATHASHQLKRLNQIDYSALRLVLYCS